MHAGLSGYRDRNITGQGNKTVIPSAYYLPLSQHLGDLALSDNA